MTQQSFVFEVTQACNHDCLHCYNVWKNAAPYPSGQLDTNATLAMLGRMLDQTRAQLVTLSGGEPLLRADIFQIIEFSMPAASRSTWFQMDRSSRRQIWRGWFRTKSASSSCRCCHQIAPFTTA